MARPRKGNGRRGRKAKREIKRVWAELGFAPEIVIPRPAYVEQQKMDGTPP